MPLARTQPRNFSETSIGRRYDGRFVRREGGAFNVNSWLVFTMNFPGSRSLLITRHFQQVIGAWASPSRLRNTQATHIEPLSPPFPRTLLLKHHSTRLGYLSAYSGKVLLPAIFRLDPEKSCLFDPLRRRAKSHIGRYQPAGIRVTNGEREKVRRCSIFVSDMAEGSSTQGHNPTSVLHFFCQKMMTTTSTPNFPEVQVKLRDCPAESSWKAHAQ